MNLMRGRGCLSAGGTCLTLWERRKKRRMCVKLTLGEGENEISVWRDKIRTLQYRQVHIFKGGGWVGKTIKPSFFTNTNKINNKVIP